MAYIYRAKNGDATNEYRFPSAATANALALKFNLDPDPISVCSDAECRNDVGDISAIGAGTYYVDGRPHTVQGAAPAVEQASQLFTAPTAPLFTGLEKNGDPNATILSRNLQINKITSWADDNSLDKTAVATFISTRGMGKTFLLKRTCDIQHRRIQEARQKARIISFDGSEVRTTKDAYMLWKKAIIRHIRVLFHNCEIDGIIFKSSDLENANTVDSTVYPTLSKWISGVMNSSLTDAVNELVRLTDIAIPTDGIQRATCMFLLDNVQSLASLDTHLTPEVSTVSLIHQN